MKILFRSNQSLRSLTEKPEPAGPLPERQPALCLDLLLLRQLRLRQQGCFQGLTTRSWERRCQVHQPLVGPVRHHHRRHHQSSTGPHQQRHHLRPLLQPTRVTHRRWSCPTWTTTNHRHPACHHHFRLRLRFLLLERLPPPTVPRCRPWTVSLPRRKALPISSPMYSILREMAPGRERHSRDAHPPGVESIPIFR